MIAGPLCEQAQLGDHGKEELGHANIHTANGAIDDAVDSELEAFQRAKDFLSYLPSNVDELAPRLTPTDPVERKDESLLSIVPREPRVYQMRQIIDSFDLDCFEIGCSWGKSIITGFARLNGFPVAVFAEDPHQYGGGSIADGCLKLTLIGHRFNLHLPVVHLEDCPGFLIGKESEIDSHYQVWISSSRRSRTTHNPVCMCRHKKARVPALPTTNLATTVRYAYRLTGALFRRGWHRSRL